MRSGLITTKLGMSSVFTDGGERLTVTLLKVENCQVVEHRTEERNGYSAVVLGARDIAARKVNKPNKKLFADSGVNPKFKLKEFRVSSDNLIPVGDELKAGHFEVGQFIDVTSRSIGKGFAGAMKRHNFSGLEATHGVSISHRSHGSTGQCQDPGRVFKGKKMAGHMGDEQVTVQNLTVVEVREEDNVLVVSGSVPGASGGMVYVRDAIKKTA